jgi:Protein of unknown function (DUF2380)
VKLLVVLVALMSMVGMPGHAAPSEAATKIAVFDFELIDTSLQGEVDGPRKDEQERLARAAVQLRQALADSGRFQVLDIAPVSVAAHNSNLQACGGCEVKLAQQIGADLVITGVVQKVSNLILNMNINLHDVHSGQQVAVMSADLRGNTDESWTRTMGWLIRNRMLAPNYGAPQPQ